MSETTDDIRQAAEKAGTRFKRALIAYPFVIVAVFFAGYFAGRVNLLF